MLARFKAYAGRSSKWLTVLFVCVKVWTCHSINTNSLLQIFRSGFISGHKVQALGTKYSSLEPSCTWNFLFFYGIKYFLYLDLPSALDPSSFLWIFCLNKFCAVFVYGTKFFIFILVSKPSSLLFISPLLQTACLRTAKSCSCASVPLAGVSQHRQLS